MTLKSFPKWNPYASKSDKRQFVNHVFEWFEGFEKKHRGFAVEGKIYAWLGENVPNWAEKGCKYMDLLILFIQKEVLGEVAKEA